MPDLSLSVMVAQELPVHQQLKDGGGRGWLLKPLSTCLSPLPPGCQLLVKYPLARNSDLRNRLRVRGLHSLGVSFTHSLRPTGIKPSKFCRTRKEITNTSSTAFSFSK